MQELWWHRGEGGHSAWTAGRAGGAPHSWQVKAAGTCGRSAGAKAWRWVAALAGPGTGRSACREPGRAACGTDPRRALVVETSLCRSPDFHLCSRENELHRGWSTQADCGVRTGARRLQEAKSGLTVQPHSCLAQSKTHSLARALGPGPGGQLPMATRTPSISGKGQISRLRTIRPRSTRPLSCCSPSSRVLILALPTHLVLSPATGSLLPKPQPQHSSPRPGRAIPSPPASPPQSYWPPDSGL